MNKGVIAIQPKTTAIATFNNICHDHKTLIVVVHVHLTTGVNYHQLQLWPLLSDSASFSSVIMSNDLNRLRLLESVFHRVTEFARTVHIILPTIRECVELHERLIDSINRILSLLRLIRNGLTGRTPRLSYGRSKG